MPVADSTFTLAPPRTAVSVALEPVHNVLMSLMLLNDAETMAGFADWVGETRARLTPAQRHDNKLVLDSLYYSIFPRLNWSSFPAYLERLETDPPASFRDRMLAAYRELPHRHEGGNGNGALAPEEILASWDDYRQYLFGRFDKDCVDLELEREAYELLVNPPALQALVSGHMRMMWTEYMEVEWERTRPMVEESVSAFRQLDFRGRTPLEAARMIIVHRDIPEYFEEKLADAQLRRIIFVPSPHLGPYVGKIVNGDVMRLFFGARLPEGAPRGSSDLSRSELLVRLNAIADDTRLQILRLLGEEGELCSQDIQQRLELSQSAASRHLKLLSAAGFLSERRRESAKCYRLNRERLDNTMQAAAGFLTANG